MNVLEHIAFPGGISVSQRGGTKLRAEVPFAPTCLCKHHRVMQLQDMLGATSIASGNYSTAELSSPFFFFKISQLLTPPERSPASLFSFKGKGIVLPT